MKIRSAVPEDKPSIIALLRQSLGESLIPKSEQLWEWKHEKNPFGPSFVLLATEEEEIIGVRAFMQWTWKWNDRQFQAIRAVDTATHPAHQGKGIFKKLTLKQLELCESDGIDFVFNTPNDQSRPGYLKMGWQQQGKMPLKMCVKSPVQLATQILFKKSAVERDFPASSESEWEKVISLLDSKQPHQPGGIHTLMNVSYVRWRYAGNPLFSYNVISDDENYVLIYRIKAHSRYLELRITDFILLNDNPSVKKDISRKLNIAARSSGAHLISMSGNQYNFYKKYFTVLGVLPVKPLGPIVTVREVNKETDMQALLKTENWQYTLGDLELF